MLIKRSDPLDGLIGGGLVLPPQLRAYLNSHKKGISLRGSRRQRFFFMLPQRFRNTSLPVPYIYIHTYIHIKIPKNVVPI